MAINSRTCKTSRIEGEISTGHSSHRTINTVAEHSRQTPRCVTDERTNITDPKQRLRALCCAITLEATQPSTATSNRSRERPTQPVRCAQEGIRKRLLGMVDVISPCAMRRHSRRKRMLTRAHASKQHTTKQSIHPSIHGVSIRFVVIRGTLHDYREIRDYCYMIVVAAGHSRTVSSLPTILTSKQATRIVSLMKRSVCVSLDTNNHVRFPSLRRNLETKFYRERTDQINATSTHSNN